MTKQVKINTVQGYQSGEAYSVGELVIYNNAVKKLTSALNHGTVATGTEFGSLGVNIDDWAANTPYSPGNMFKYSGAIWNVNTACSGATWSNYQNNITPFSTPGKAFTSDYGTYTASQLTNISSSMNTSGILTGRSNTISAGSLLNPSNTTSDCYILSGVSNNISGTGNVVGGGQSNTIIASTATNLSPTYSCILGGISNSIRGNYNFIGGGNTNKTYQTGFTIGYSYSTIVAGTNNSTYGDYACIVGGSSNTVTGQYGVIVGGLSNSAGQNSAVLSGSSNIASGQYSTILNGSSNTLSGYYQTQVNGNNSTNITTYGATIDTTYSSAYKGSSVKYKPVGYSGGSLQVLTTDGSATAGSTNAPLAILPQQTIGGDVQPQVALHSVKIVGTHPSGIIQTLERQIAVCKISGTISVNITTIGADYTQKGPGATYTCSLSFDATVNSGSGYDVLEIKVRDINNPANLWRWFAEVNSTYFNS